MNIVRRGVKYLQSRSFGPLRLPSEPGLNNGCREQKIIVSLTSYPGRIGIVARTVESLLKQTCKPDKIVLYLAEEQFPNRRLPKSILKAQKCGLEVKFVKEDLRPHKKYFYAMQEYPEEIIITCDDDIYYNQRLIETLMNSYVQHPKAISACRAHRITFSDSGTVLPYTQWIRGNKELVGQERFDLVATGVGGVLYPPHAIPEIAFDKEAIISTCRNADDLWLKITETINRCPVVLVEHDWSLKEIYGTKKSALCNNNVGHDENTVQFNKILEHFHDYTLELTERLHH